IITAKVEETYDKIIHPVSDLLKSTAIACTQKGNYTLWKQIIDCHRPLPSKFLRESSEANCAVRKHVQDPTNWRYTLQEVFFNICGLVEEKNTADKNRGLNCLLNGRAGCPRLMSHEEEVRVVKCRFGRNVPCEIGECINNLNIGG
ncbi:hypothetical protein Bhyg_10720, partial [Pseudolycoriella hygida]